ncbi:MAG: hypothetical protein P4L90_25750 [Rhodopila sp.]|nr:hypothetical protein [Rhodopila sp.]
MSAIDDRNPIASVPNIVPGTRNVLPNVDSVMYVHGSTTPENSPNPNDVETTGIFRLDDYNPGNYSGGAHNSVLVGWYYADPQMGSAYRVGAIGAEGKIDLQGGSFGVVYALNGNINSVAVPNWTEMSGVASQIVTVSAAGGGSVLNAFGANFQTLSYGTTLPYYVGFNFKAPTDQSSPQGTIQNTVGFFMPGWASWPGYANMQNVYAILINEPRAQINTRGQIIPAYGAAEVGPTASAGYAPLRWYYGVHPTGATSNLQLPATGTATPVYFYCKNRISFTELSIYVTSAISGGSVELGVYKLAGSVPTTLVASATIPVSSTGQQTATGLNIPLEAGPYVVYVNASSQGSPTLRYIQDSGTIEVMGDSAPGAEQSMFYSRTFGTAWAANPTVSFAAGQGTMQPVVAFGYQTN